MTKSKAELAAENAEKDKARLLNLKTTNPTAYQAELKKREAAQATAAQNAKISAERSAFMKKNYLNDWTYDSTRDKQGNYYLVYPDQLKHTKTKLVVHHTAMEYDTQRTPEEIKQHLQRIYRYHTIDRDFGDIGYNFLIDHLGNIYEGRAGGEGAVGMHVAYNNIASVGISLMGNFEETEPSQAQIDALTDLLTALAKQYHIDPTAQEQYFQPSSSAPYMSVKTLSTIVGHGDIAPTACP
ncbi:MAG: N-acetylmuramoyl-L-alanine amidase [Candidatus Peribacteria bacterium]|nr:N-acetylmuramoyl-L-alanine amidase [Candidatus Peribacteria bacterium]